MRIFRWSSKKSAKVGRRPASERYLRDCASCGRLRSVHPSRVTSAACHAAPPQDAVLEIERLETSLQRDIAGLQTGAERAVGEHKRAAQQQEAALAELRREVERLRGEAEQSQRQAAEQGRAQQEQQQAALAELRGEVERLRAEAEQTKRQAAEQRRAQQEQQEQQQATLAALLRQLERLTRGEDSDQSEADALPLQQQQPRRELDHRLQQAAGRASGATRGAVGAGPHQGRLNGWRSSSSSELGGGGAWPLHRASTPSGSSSGAPPSIEALMWATHASTTATAELLAELAAHQAEANPALAPEDGTLLVAQLVVVSEWYLDLAAETGVLPQLQRLRDQAPAGSPQAPVAGVSGPLPPLQLGQEPRDYLLGLSPEQRAELFLRMFTSESREARRAWYTGLSQPQWWPTQGPQ
jgi:hypothetical protein